MPSNPHRHRTRPKALPKSERLKEGTLVYCQGKWSWGEHYTGTGVVVSDKGKPGVKVLFTDDATGVTKLTGIYRPHIWVVDEQKETDDEKSQAAQQEPI